MAERVTIVTGVSRGIGLAIAQSELRQGRHVVGLARSRPAGLAGTFVAVDLGDREATVTALAEIVTRYEVDRLVNNAGIARVAAIEAMTLEDLDATIAVNLTAATLVMKAVIPGMRARRFGRIVNIGSRAALGKAGRSIYGASKAALLSMTRTVALEVAGDGITVNCIAPGPIETEMIRLNYPAGSASRDGLTRAIPAGRFGEPEEIAAACDYFLSDAAGFTTGQALYVCGGASIGQAPY